MTLKSFLVLPLLCTLCTCCEFHFCFPNLLIDGKFVPSISGKRFDTINPATEKIIANVAEAGIADIDAAVTAARTAFEGPWRTTSASDRSRLINRLANLIEENIDELATLESLDCGKPYMDAKTVDIPLVLSTLRYFAGWPDKIHGTSQSVSVRKLFRGTAH
ncbi:putative aldehyde dehydrogenase domain, aldehyde/histidinol dehydrogenase [Plasmopara halstedii]